MTPASPDQSSQNALNLSALALVLRQSCVELMADYGVSVTPQKWGAPAESSSASLATEVAFSGRHLRGSVLLCATRGVILATAQEVSASHAGFPPSLGDWNGEIVNQLVGRMKNKLRTQHGVSIDVGVPRAVAPCEPFQLDYDVRQGFSCTAGTFLVCLAVLFELELVFGERESDADLPSEGELLLF